MVRILNSVVRRVQEAGHLLLERLLRGKVRGLGWKGGRGGGRWWDGRRRMGRGKVCGGVEGAGRCQP